MSSLTVMFGHRCVVALHRYGVEFVIVDENAGTLGPLRGQ
jgi:hypothetical protein